MNKRKKRKGVYAIAVALVVLFVILVVITLVPELKKTVIDLLTAAKSTAS
ncbi:MAG: hypothetical protein KAQ92_07650 [Candidatus Aenigmarchaeota archaeon]|nr:hypothetical protein [Candidatus Aenigmarchaeota archaeon]